MTEEYLQIAGDIWKGLDLLNFVGLCFRENFSDEERRKLLMDYCNYVDGRDRK